MNAYEIEELAKMDQVEKIEESDTYYYVFVRDYGNASVLSKLEDLPTGNFTIADDDLIKFNIRK